MQHQDNGERPLDMNEMSLREHLLAAQAAEAVGQSHMQHQHQSPPTTSPPPVQQPLDAHQHHFDPSMSETYAMNAMDLEDDQETGYDGKKGGKRELSNSKRAAQNRAAQRAFRQRKEGYIKKLEDQVRTYSVMEASYKHTQTENYELRAYIQQLQSRLLEVQGSYPPPPPTFSVDSHRPPIAQTSLQRPNPLSINASPQDAHRVSAPTTSMVTNSPPAQSQLQQQLNDGYPAPPPPPQSPHQQQRHDRYGPIDSRETHMDPSAVAQLKAAAAAAEAPAPSEEQDLKYAVGTNDDEQAYTMEAARAAAYAASKPSVDGADNESAVHLSHLLHEQTQ